jgi:TldD protein
MIGRYHAPFAEHGSHTVDADIADRLLRAARASDPRVVRVDASFAESIREVLIANSFGHMAHDRQPLIRFGIRVIAEDGSNRQSGSSGGGGSLSS